MCPQHSHKSLQDCVLETSEGEPRETVVGTDRHGYEYLHFPQLLVRDVRVYRRKPWRAPAHWVQQARTDADSSPSRLVAAGQRWTKTKLRKLQQKLAALRRDHAKATPRPAAARHACLRPTTPVGSPGESGEEAEERDEEEEEVIGEVEDLTREDGDWRAPARLSAGVGRGRGRGSAALPAPLSPPPPPPIPPLRLKLPPAAKTPSTTPTKTKVFDEVSSEPAEVIVAGRESRKRYC